MGFTDHESLDFFIWAISISFKIVSYDGVTRMSNKMKKDNKLKLIGIYAVAAILMLATVVIGDTEQPLANAIPTVQITDVVGRTVEIPANVTCVASLAGQGYDKFIILNQIDRVSEMHPVTCPWAFKVAPQLKDIPIVASENDPNIEDLLSKNVQVVFSMYFRKGVDKMTDAGIPVVVPQFAADNDNSGLPQNESEFEDLVKQEMMLYGRVLGPEAEKNADDWCEYFDQLVKHVKSRTQGLNSSQRPTVFWGKGPDPQITHTKNSYLQWYVEIAGADYAAENVTGAGVQTISIEKIIKWNPDFIFLGRVNNTSNVMDDPKWKNIKAVQNGNVYLSPAGVSWWDYGSEGVLFMEFVAKTIHPELFQDLDMIKEIKEYYSKFYRYDLTDEEANRILKHLPPAN